MTRPHNPSGSTSHPSFLGEKPGTQRHHRIPAEWSDVKKSQHPVIAEFLKLGKDSTTIFDFDSGRDNGMYLASDVYGAGKHPTLSAYSFSLLEKIQNDDIEFVELTTGSPTPERARELREGLGPKLERVALRSGFATRAISILRRSQQGQLQPNQVCAKAA